MFGGSSVNCYLDDLVILISLDGCKFLRVLLSLQERSQRKGTSRKHRAAGVNALRTRTYWKNGYSVGVLVSLFLAGPHQNEHDDSCNCGGRSSPRNPGCADYRSLITRLLAGSQSVVLVVDTLGIWRGKRRTIGGKDLRSLVGNERLSSIGFAGSPGAAAGVAVAVSAAAAISSGVGAVV